MTDTMPEAVAGMVERLEENDREIYLPLLGEAAAMLTALCAENAELKAIAKAIQDALVDCQQQARHYGAQRDTLRAERDQARADLAEAVGKLKPFAFLEMEKDEGLADSQYVWETIYNDRVQDWFAFDEIDDARAFLGKRDT